MSLALIFIVAEIPDRLIEVLSNSKLPQNWDDLPVPNSTRSVGDAWIALGRGLALSVPSVLIPRRLTSERNVLINPAHPALAKVKVRRVPFIHRPRS